MVSHKVQEKGEGREEEEKEDKEEENSGGRVSGFRDFTFQLVKESKMSNSSSGLSGGTEVMAKGKLLFSTKKRLVMSSLDSRGGRPEELLLEPVFCYNEPMLASALSEELMVCPLTYSAWIY